MNPSLEKLLKERFVEEWLRHNDPFKAALLVFPDNTGEAIRIANQWPMDEQVLEIRREAGFEEGGLVPSKEVLITKAVQIADDASNKGDERVKALRLAAEMCGYIQKPDVAIDQRSISITNNNRVMAIRDHGSDEEWEERLAQQQHTLTHQADRKTN